MSATHPPIPPNCPYFIETPHGWIFQVSGPGFKTVACYVAEVERYPAWSGVIAAVAEVAWREEAEALSLDAYHAGGRDEEGNIQKEADRAGEIADAWRAWGKGEWKP